MTFQTPIDEYNHLTNQRNKLALRLKEIAAKKKELKEDISLKDEIEAIISEAENKNKKACGSIKEITNKAGIPIFENRSQLTLTLSENKSLEFLLEGGYDILFTINATLALQQQYNRFIKKGDLGNFCKKVKTDMRDLIELHKAEETFKEVYIQQCIYLDNFETLLKQFKANEDKFKKLTIEGRKYIKELKKIEKRRRKLEPKLQIFHTYFEKYNKQSNYTLAHQQAREFAKIIERNRKELVRYLANESHIISMRYGSLKLNLQSSFGNNYNSACRAYEILQKITDNTSSYKAMLAAKKDLLKICYCNNPKKEVGLFRKEVMDWNYGLEKRDAADILAAVRHLDEIAIMHLQKRSELKTQINELTSKLEILSKHKFL